MIVRSRCSGKERRLNLNSLLTSATLKGPQGPQGAIGAQGPQGESGAEAATLGPKSATDVVTIDSLNAPSNACVGLGGTVEGRFAVYTVPANRALVITEATVSGLEAGSYSQMGESTGGTIHWKIKGALFSAAPNSNGTSNSWRYSSNVGVSFAPGSTVIITCYDLNGGGQTLYAWHLSGYLTD